ncbi:putative thymidylate kinase [uncultured archaeon]|nr:putative thymidylate kinase [uncultured archaeon]
MVAKLIVFEGVNRAGKTTQAKLLFDFFAAQKFNVLYVKEPQNKKIGAIAKQMIRKKNFSPETVALAFAADTMQHIDETIKPALEKYDYIIADRYYHSAYAYHPLMGCKPEWIHELHRYVLKPDITFILDIQLSEYKKRTQKGEKDPFENDEFQQKLRVAYIGLSKILNEEIAIIAGGRSIKEIHSEIRKKVMYL